MREKIVSFRVTDAEYHFLKERAKHLPGGVSDVLRRMMSNYEAAWISPGTPGVNSVNASKFAYYSTNGGNKHG